MLKVGIEQVNGGRLLFVSSKDLQHWALHDTTDTPLVFKLISKTKAVALAHTDVLVYHKPNAVQFGDMAILHSRSALHMGSNLYKFGTRDVRPEFDRLKRNMYEYHGIL